MAVDVGDVQQSGFQFDKRTLLIGAALLGGAVGLVILLSRMGKSENRTETDEQTEVSGASPMTLAYQNLAEQLLGVRGDVSVANATLAQNQQDLLSVIGDESANRAVSDTELRGLLANYFTGVAGQVSGVQSQLANIGSEVHAGNAMLHLIGVRQYYGNQYTPQEPTQTGAGGALMRDIILAEADAGYGSIREGNRLLSAGPVRRLVA